MYTVIDFETTGLNHNVDEVIEIAAIKVNKNMERISELHLYVKTSLKISTFITNLTGLTNEFLEENGCEQVRAFDILRKFIGRSVIVAQYTPFDLSFLEFMSNRKYDFYCTRSLNLKAFPNESSSLKPTCDRLGIPLFIAHKATDDVYATLELFKYHIENGNTNGMKNKLIIDDRILKYIPTQTEQIQLVNYQVIFDTTEGK